MVGSLTEASARHGPATCVLHPAINLQRIVVGTAGLAGTTPLSLFTARDYLSPPARPGADPMRVQRVRAKRAGVLMICQGKVDQEFPHFFLRLARSMQACGTQPSAALNFPSSRRTQPCCMSFTMNERELFGPSPQVAHG